MMKKIRAIGLLALWTIMIGLSFVSFDSVPYNQQLAWVTPYSTPLPQDMPEPQLAFLGSIIGAVVGGAIGLFGASQQRKASRSATARELAALGETAREQFALSEIGIESKFALREKGLSLEARQDELFTRLRGIQIRQQADIAVARRRTQQQRVRIGGVGGSFARIRGGESEIKTEVQRQLEQLQIERGARTEQRELELFAAEERRELGLQQAEVTKQAGIRGATSAAASATTAADIGFVGAATGFASSLVQSPAVVSAISGFFAPTPVSTGATTLISPTNPLGLTSGQGL